MALSANELTTKRASANHSTATKYQFEIPSKASRQQIRLGEHNIGTNEGTEQL